MSKPEHHVQRDQPPPSTHHTSTTTFLPRHRRRMHACGDILYIYTYYYYFIFIYNLHVTRVRVPTDNANDNDDNIVILATINYYVLHRVARSPADTNLLKSQNACCFQFVRFVSTFLTDSQPYAIENTEVSDHIILVKHTPPRLCVNEYTPSWIRVKFLPTFKTYYFIFDPYRFYFIGKII